MGAAVAFGQSRALRETQQRLSVQVDLVARIERIKGFKDVGAGLGKGLGPHEVLGAARFEQAFGRTIRESLTEGANFLDGLFGRVQLKGPLVDGNRQLLPMTPQNIGGLFDSVIEAATSGGRKFTSDSDTVAVDLLGLSASQQKAFISNIAARVDDLVKPIIFIQ